MQQHAEEGFRTGFIGIVGPPNVGKSTLLNRMIGQKISITSKKPQTTRNRIQGIVNRPGCQLVFIDTPGIHTARSPLNTRIVETALSVMGDVDVLLLVVDASDADPESEAMLKTALQNQNRPVILALNKIDLIARPSLLSMIADWSAIYPFKAVVPVSAETGEQVDALLQALSETLPEGPAFFPEENLTDLSVRFLAGEIIREKVFRQTGQEIPYSVAVTIDLFKEDEKKADLTRIHATIHVERDSQKGILIGKQGSKLGRIGEDSRKEIERMLGKRVFLKLYVRVEKNWSKDSRFLSKFGY
ncbi:MAG: GTPase Era [Deltaproteobacteria bacterium]|nr:GTPase Era [Deltaproteobacteria bacterium]